jgi:hypothetical protein
MRSAQPTIRRTASESQTCRLAVLWPLRRRPGRIAKGCLLCARMGVLAGSLLSQVVRVLCLPPPRAEGGPTSPLSNFPGSRHDPWL